MHDFRLAGSLIRRIEETVRNSRGGRVREVVMTLGPLSDFTPDHFREHCEQAARGTLLEGAAFVILQSRDLTSRIGQDVLVESVTFDEEPALLTDLQDPSLN